MRVWHVVFYDDFSVDSTDMNMFWLSSMSSDVLRSSSTPESLYHRLLVSSPVSVVLTWTPAPPGEQSAVEAHEPGGIFFFIKTLHFNHIHLTPVAGV